MKKSSITILYLLLLGLCCGIASDSPETELRELQKSQISNLSLVIPDKGGVNISFSAAKVSYTFCVGMRTNDGSDAVVTATKLIDQFRSCRSVTLTIKKSSSSSNGIIPLGVEFHYE